MAHVAEYKKKTVTDFVALMEKYPIIGVVNMQNLPSAQLQKMRQKLRGKVELLMTKRRLMELIIDEVKEKKPGIEKLLSLMGGMPALLFTRENPFPLARTLQQNKSKASAKAGQIAPNDIVIEPGKTAFSPGPVISELSQAGLKTGVEDGKVAIKERKVLVKAGEVIKENIAKLLAKLNITPMDIGLDLVAVYEQGIIYTKDVLNVDIKEVLGKVCTAAANAYNLAMDTCYPVKETIGDLLSKAHSEALALALDRVIFEKEVLAQLFAKAYGHMLGVEAMLPPS